MTVVVELRMLMARACGHHKLPPLGSMSSQNSDSSAASSWAADAPATDQPRLGPQAWRDEGAAGAAGVRGRPGDPGGTREY